MTAIEATVAAMDRHYRPGVFTWSPITGERNSANPADYWWLDEGAPLTDSEGHPMVLATCSDPTPIGDEAER